MRDGISTGEPAIVLGQVHVRLASAAGEVNILRGLDLTVAAGEAVGVVGPSGGGKSTMMMVVAGSCGIRNVDPNGPVTLTSSPLLRLAR